MSPDWIVSTTVLISALELWLLNILLKKIRSFSDVGCGQKVIAKKILAPLPSNLEHLSATYGAITNWATFARPLEIDGVQQLHLPLLDWNASTPPAVFGAVVAPPPQQ